MGFISTFKQLSIQERYIHLSLLPPPAKETEPANDPPPPPPPAKENEPKRTPQEKSAKPKHRNRRYKVKKPNISGKEGAKSPPDWVKYQGERPMVGESGKEFARRVMDERWGKGKWQKDNQGKKEFSKIKKWADRNFKNPNNKK